MHGEWSQGSVDENLLFAQMRRCSSGYCHRPMLFRRASWCRVGTSAIHIDRQGVKPTVKTVLENHG